MTNAVVRMKVRRDRQFGRFRKLDAIVEAQSECQVYDVNTPFPATMKKRITARGETIGGRLETMQNNKRPVGRADEGVIFKFNSAVPRDKRAAVPPPPCAPTRYILWRKTTARCFVFDDVQRMNFHDWTVLFTKI